MTTLPSSSRQLSPWDAIWAPSASYLAAQGVGGLQEQQQLGVVYLQQHAGDLTGQRRMHRMDQRVEALTCSRHQEDITAMQDLQHFQSHYKPSCPPSSVLQLERGTRVVMVVEKITACRQTYSSTSQQHRLQAKHSQSHCSTPIPLGDLALSTGHASQEGNWCGGGQPPLSGQEQF